MRLARIHARSGSSSSPPRFPSNPGSTTAGSPVNRYLDGGFAGDVWVDVHTAVTLFCRSRLWAGPSFSVVSLNLERPQVEIVLKVVSAAQRFCVQCEPGGCMHRRRASGVVVGIGGRPSFPGRGGIKTLSAVQSSPAQSSQPLHPRTWGLRR